MAALQQQMNIYTQFQSNIASMLAILSTGIDSAVTIATADGLATQKLQHQAQEFKTEVSLINESLQTMYDAATESISKL